jgi:hypothetical protein
MKSHCRAVVLCAALIAGAGCTSQAAKDAAGGPAFTAEEKAAMTEEQKLAIYNEQVREQDRVTCVRKKTVGTRLSSRVCTTAAERAREHEDAQRIMGEMHRNSPSPKGD